MPHLGSRSSPAWTNGWMPAPMQAAAKPHPRLRTPSPSSPSPRRKLAPPSLMPLSLPSSSPPTTRAPAPHLGLLGHGEEDVHTGHVERGVGGVAQGAQEEAGSIEDGIPLRSGAGLSIGLSIGGGVPLRGGAGQHIIHTMASEWTHIGHGMASTVREGCCQSLARGEGRAAWWHASP